MAKERKLANKKRIFPKGRAIRVSNLVYDTLDAERCKPTNRRRSWDSFFRKMLGLPDRSGNSQALVEGMLEVTTGMFLLKTPTLAWDELDETAWKIAHKAALKKKVKQVEKPLRMRELP